MEAPGHGKLYVVDVGPDSCSTSSMARNSSQTAGEVWL